MSLIPFILDLADELQEFNRSVATGMDVDDFGIYPHEFEHEQLQQQQLQQHLQHQLRRPRSLSQFYWLPSLKQRNHPYNRSSKACCNKSAAGLHLHSDSEKESNVAAVVCDKETPGTPAAKSAYSVVNKNGFQVSMNVKQFAPNELTVKTIDNCIVVSGKHEDKEDGHGVISRHFIRKYMLPKGYDPNEVLSTLSSDGILTVKVPAPATKMNEPLERIVDIQHTGPTQLSVRDSPNKEQAKTAAAAQPQQNQQQQQQQQQEEELEKVIERNGDDGTHVANSNENHVNVETEPATAAVEEPMLISNDITPSAIDANVAAAAAAVNAADNVDSAAAAVDNDTNNTNDNGIADIPMVVVTEAAAPEEVVIAGNDSSGIGAENKENENGDDAMDNNGVVDKSAVVENLVVAAPQPTVADLVAADTAILLAKIQCENGTNQPATEEMAN